jgi:hypothetical protein
LTSSTTRLPCTGITARTNRTNKPARAARSGRPRFSHDLQIPLTHSPTYSLTHPLTHVRAGRVYQNLGRTFSLTSIRSIILLGPWPAGVGRMDHPCWSPSAST